MNLIHVLNRGAFLLPEFQNFVLKAFASDPLVFAGDVFIELSNHMENPNIGLFVTMNEQNRFVGLVVVGNSTTALSPGAVVLHFYNEGADAESRKLLIQAAVEFAKAHGHKKIRGIDVNGRSDAFVRLFEAAGPAKELGRAYEFHFADEGE